MRFFLTLGVLLLLVGCSDEPAKEVKTPVKPPEPLTGRQAFQMTFSSARAWAPDSQPLRIRSLNLEDPKSVDGKAGAWEITYVSESRGHARPFTWSSVEAQGLHKGVFASPEEPWRGPSGQDRPFVPAAIRIDTPEALKNAIAKSGDYLKKAGTKPQVNFMLENISRFADPAWRVYWGNSVSSAEWTVFIDASAGGFLGN